MGESRHKRVAQIRLVYMRGVHRITASMGGQNLNEMRKGRLQFSTIRGALDDWSNGCYYQSAAATRCRRNKMVSGS